MLAKRIPKVAASGMEESLLPQSRSRGSVVDQVPSERIRPSRVIELQHPGSGHGSWQRPVATGRARRSCVSPHASLVQQVRNTRVVFLSRPSYGIQPPPIICIIVSLIVCGRVCSWLARQRQPSSVEQVRDTGCAATLNLGTAPSPVV